MGNITIISTFDNIDAAEKCLRKIRENVTGIIDADILPRHNTELPQSQQTTNSILPLSYLGMASQQFVGDSYSYMGVLKGTDYVGKSSVNDLEECNLRITVTEQARHDAERHIINQGGTDTTRIATKNDFHF